LNASYPKTTTFAVVNMKKVFVTILALIYLTASNGTWINMHYCMGQLAEVKFHGHPSEKCAKCGMKQTKIDNGCCRDEYKFFKYQPDQQLNSSNIQVPLFDAYAIPVSAFESIDANQLSISHFFPGNHAPPRAPAVAIIIQHRNFRI